MSELDVVRNRIRAAEEDLDEARRVGDREHQLEIRRYLSSLHTKEERLLGESRTLPPSVFDLHHVAGARPSASLFPPPHPDLDEDRVMDTQLELTGVDGNLAALGPYRGSRNFVKSRCTEFGLRGYVWREPNTRVKILAAGTKAQLTRLLEFCDELRSHAYIESYVSEKPERIVLTKGFDKLPSHRRHCHTGAFSDKADDDVKSTVSSGDAAFLGSPSPGEVKHPWHGLSTHHHSDHEHHEGHPHPYCQGDHGDPIAHEHSHDHGHPPSAPFAHPENAHYALPKSRPTTSHEHGHGHAHAST